MEEKVYPVLPSAPPDNIEATFHRNKVSEYLTSLTTTRNELTKKFDKHYKRASKLCSVVDVAGVVSVLFGVGGIASAFTIFALPLAVAAGVISTVLATSTVITSKHLKTCKKKINKYAKMIDDINSSITKIDTLISESLNRGGGISSDEFKKARDEYTTINSKINNTQIKSKNELISHVLKEIEELKQR